MKVFVILLNWNGWQDTIECLTSLLTSVGVDFVTVVCDNDSTDGSLEQLRTWSMSALPSGSTVFMTGAEVADGMHLGPTVKVAFVRNSRNFGFAGGNNVGIRLAMNDCACRYVWLLNNDTVVTPDALATVVAHAEADTRIGLCGSTLIYYHDRFVVQAFGGAVFNKGTGRARHLGAFAPLTAIPVDPVAIESSLSYVAGAAMLVRREYIEQVGLMQDDYFLYFEEIDWATRGRGRFRLGYAPRSWVYHKEGASIGTAPSGGSPLSVYYLFRNRLRFTKRFYPLRLFTVVPACIWDIVKLALRGRSHQAVAALRGMLLLPIAPMNGLARP